MRVYSQKFNERNVALRKEIRWVIAISFDLNNTDVYYFTSHKDCEVPPGTLPQNTIYSVVKKPVITSQKIDIRSTKFTIGSLTFDLIDDDEVISNLLNSKLTAGFGLRRKRVRIYRGYAGLVWSDYHIPPGGTQLIEGKTSTYNGVYTFRCNDIQRSEKKTICDPKKSNLTQTYNAGDSTVSIVDTEKFEMVSHGSSFTESPNSTVGYFELNKDSQRNIIRYTGKTGTTFTGCVGGRFNTKDFSVEIDANVANDRQPEVKEFIPLEMPAVKMAMSLLTGTNPTLPDHWHMNIPSEYVNVDELNNIGLDLYDTTDETKGRKLRFDGIEKVNGKQFIEEQVNRAIGCFMPVKADGRLGYKRITGVLSGASPVLVLDSSNVISYSPIDHDNPSVANRYAIRWNKIASKKDSTRINIYEDYTSIDVHQVAKTIGVSFDGLHGSFATDSIIEDAFDVMRDRYAGPPILITVKCFDSVNGIELGNVVWCDFNQRDFTGGGDLNRAFEVIGYKSSGADITLELFGSSQRPDPIVTPSNQQTALQDAYYSEGLLPENKIDVATTGSYSGGVWHITNNSTLTGTGDMNAVESIFWFDGSAVIDSNVILDLEQNAQIRIMNTQNNGIINLSGNGLPGAIKGSESPGVPGWIGATKSGAGFDFYLRSGSADRWILSRPTQLVEPYTGQSNVPRLEISNNGVSIDGIHTDMRSTSGSAGMNLHNIYDTGFSPIWASGGAGGNGGAACVFITRVFASGAGSKINLDGEKGQPGESGILAGRTVYAGAGATASPAVFYLIMDGNSSVIPSLSDFSAKMDAPLLFGSPHVGRPNFKGVILVDLLDDDEPWPIYSKDIGLSGFGDLNNSFFRMQRLAAAETPAEDADAGPLSPPTNISVESGTERLIKQADGTIVVRALVKWVPSNDVRATGYSVRFKKSTESIYSYLVDVDGRETNQAFVANLSDGENWDFGIRVKSDTEFGNWVDIFNEQVIGKTADPSDVISFLVQRQPDGTREFDWIASEDVDHRGYKIRYTSGANGVWETMTPLHTGLLNASPFETNQLAAGIWTFAIKQVDTTGNESTNALYINGVTLADPRIAGSIGLFDPRLLSWPGLKTNCWVDNDGNLYATDTKTWDDLGIDGITWDTWTSWARAPNTTIVYEHSLIDIGVIATFIPLVSATSNGAVTIEEQHSDDNITFTNWAFTGDQISARYLRIRVTATHLTELVSVTQMLIILSADPIEEFIEDRDTATLTGANRVAVGHVKLPLINNYAIIKSVNVVLQNVGAGWSWELISKADLINGPEIKIYNNGALADAMIDAGIRGL